MATTAPPPLPSADGALPAPARLAGAAAIGTGPLGLASVVACLVPHSATLDALVLVLGALLSAAVLVTTVYPRLARPRNPLALSALLLVVAVALDPAPVGAQSAAPPVPIVRGEVLSADGE